MTAKSDQAFASSSRWKWSTKRTNFASLQVFMNLLLLITLLKSKFVQPLNFNGIATPFNYTSRPKSNDLILKVAVFVMVTMLSNNTKEYLLIHTQVFCSRPNFFCLVLLWRHALLFRGGSSVNTTPSPKSKNKPFQHQHISKGFN